VLTFLLAPLICDVGFVWVAVEVSLNK
jgi:hypothetical protein